ncbi:MAG TPA: glycosyltransferase family 2 protein [Candidatus Limnocylindria bacterium]|nr:glycosyltransferase family 2 protein [Candidatus Limnocylindria bacterium]
MTRRAKGRRGAGRRRRSEPATLPARIRRLARLVLNFATPVRSGLIAVVAAGLFAGVVADQLLLQLAGVAVATLAIVSLLAIIDQRRRRGRRGRFGGGAAASLDEQAPPSRAIGRSASIITVVIPGKNEAAYARDCIWSLKHQTLANFDAILIDDASTDSTLDVILAEIGDDPRFQVIRTASSVGIGLARNLGVARSTAKYVTFLDLDDFLAPDALASRVELAERHADQPWVAGAYCWHDTVDPETTPRDWIPPRAVGLTRPTISWLSHLDDAMFIASAPIVRRDAFLAVGGFDDAPTAEDQVLWFKLLRWGFTLLPTDAVGVAYRRKPTSHAVFTAVAMRDTITRLLAERSESASVPASQNGPFFFAEDLGTYRTAVGFTRRTAAALGIAIAEGNQEALRDRLLADLATVPDPLVGWAVDVGEVALGGSRRVTRARGERALEAPIVREIERSVGPVLATARGRASAWLDAAEVPALPQRGAALAVGRPRLLPVTPRSLQSIVSDGRPFLLLPSSAYHTDELIELVPELRRRGFAPVAMLNDKRWATTGSALARVDVPAVKDLPPDTWLLDFAALLTFNDWGEYFGDYVKYVAGQPTVSFAKVEGVQDWLDHDTGRVRNAYLASDVILCQGDNDVAALEGRRGGLEVIGSDRLEAIWKSPLPADRSPRVVANVNFTYGVQSEHRDLWVSTLRDACRSADVPLELSLHPSESARFPGLAAAEPIRHLMVTDSILVSRFSTVLFEGMARGCSVIYYNPHGEEVPTFHHPDGAFDIANDPQALATHLRTAMSRTRAEAKERAAAFFERQVSMIPGASVATRTADAIERNLAPS